MATKSDRLRLGLVLLVGAVAMGCYEFEVVPYESAMPNTSPVVIYRLNRVTGTVCAREANVVHAANLTGETRGALGGLPDTAPAIPGFADGVECTGWDW